MVARIEFGDGLVARLDGLGESDLVVLREQRVLPDVGEIETDEVFVVAVDAVFGHLVLLLCRFDDGIGGAAGIVECSACEGVW